MKKMYFVLSLFTVIVNANAQTPATPTDASKKEYRSFATQSTDLVHTKLQASFNFDKAYLNGKAWLTLKPHFYATDSVVLDAKGMNINKVNIVKAATSSPLSYRYDSLQLVIKLDKTYKGGEAYTLYIDYTAKPNEYTAQGSAAITDAKGLYFINPKGEDSTKPTQIWTQGETEANSVWVPTIDKPNQKTTQEFYLTVPKQYVTLSNGKLISQTPNANGTRTDYWKMDLPHAPYLMFMGVGNYAVIKDSYKGKEVSYYVEKEYASVARKIFGLTPEMMRFFSEKVTGIDYPWAKYAQIVGRDYVSGAMENTTATLHQESAQQNARELVDANHWESTIAHELFHHWFGDYVTAESWSNLTVNESFANYSETLWNEYKYGADAAADQNLVDMTGYLNSNSAKKDLVRFYYADKEEMFDAVSYNKGGRILHMLRNYIGNEAFFKSLNVYLSTNKFGTGNAHKLRLAFEAVTGQDLNWFFNQWYFGSGHPNVSITYQYDAATKKVGVIVKQLQAAEKIFRLPITIDVYQGITKKRHLVWASNAADTFLLDAATRPSLVNVDADKILLWEKEDNKSLEEYIHQYNYAKNYVDRREAIDAAAKNKKEPQAFQLLIKALNDPYFKLRNRTLSYLQDTILSADVLATIQKIATSDPNRYCRSYAINALNKTGNKSYLPLYIAAVTDSSYTVAGAALSAIGAIDEQKAIELLPQLKKDAKGALKTAIETIELLTKGDADFENMHKKFVTSAGLQEKFNALPNYISFLGRVNNTVNFKTGIDAVVAFRKQIEPYGAQLKPMVNGLITALIAKKTAAKAKNTQLTTDLDEQIAYIQKVTKD